MGHVMRIAEGAILIMKVCPRRLCDRSVTAISGRFVAVPVCKVMQRFQEEGVKVERDA